MIINNINSLLLQQPKIKDNDNKQAIKKISDNHIKKQAMKPNPNNNPYSDITKIKDEMDSVSTSNTISSLYIKLQTGSELTSSELEYLKQNNPELYTKAIQAKQERELYEKQLKNCTTKEQVKSLNLSKVTGLGDAQNKISSNENISSSDGIKYKMSADEDEYLKFTDSKKYYDLPSEYDTKNNKKSKKSLTTITVYLEDTQESDITKCRDRQLDKLC